jgi:hypothetical protein
VILRDENTPRSEWKMGRVTEVMPGQDGLVRNVAVEIANRNLDKKGKRMSDPTTLKRSIQKLVVLMSA